MKFAIFVFSLLQASFLQAAIFNVVNGADSVGSNLTLSSPVLLTDTLTLNVTGEVFLQGNGRFGTNAAGVLTTEGSYPVGATFANGAFNFGELLLGNAAVGFHRLFPANAANGLGSAKPPSALSMGPATFASLGFGTNLAAGTVLTFIVSDTQYGDNFGSFTVSGDINSGTPPPPPPAAVAEPSTLGLLSFGCALLGLVRARRQYQLSPSFAKQ